MMRKRVMGIFEASYVQMLILTTKQLFPSKCEYGLNQVRSPDGEAAGWTPARNYTRAEQFKVATDIMERFCYNLTFGYHTSIRNNFHRYTRVERFKAATDFVERFCSYC